LRLISFTLPASRPWSWAAQDRWRSKVFWQSAEKPRVLRRTRASSADLRGAGGADGPEEGEDARAPMPASSTGHYALETHNAEIAAAIYNFLDRTTRLSSGTRGSNHRPSLSITRSRPPHCPPGQAAFPLFCPADWLRSGDRSVNSQSRRIDGRSGPDDQRQLPSRLLQEKRT
jgi:hypothetical protein